VLYILTHYFLEFLESWVLTQHSLMQALLVLLLLVLALAQPIEMAPMDENSDPLIEQHSSKLTAHEFVAEPRKEDGDSLTVPPSQLAQLQDSGHALLLEKPIKFYPGHMPDSSHVPNRDVETHTIYKARDFGFKSVRFKYISFRETIESAAHLAALVPSAPSYMAPVPCIPSIGTRSFGFKDPYEERIGSEGDIDDQSSTDVVTQRSATSIQDQVSSEGSLLPGMGSDGSSHL
jgi:hypothetical protein